MNKPLFLSVVVIIILVFILSTNISVSPLPIPWTLSTFDPFVKLYFVCYCHYAEDNSMFVVR